MDSTVKPPRLSFDEFKLYYESAEKVTDRRLDTNRWNYSICIAILVAIAVLTKWSLTTAHLLWIGFGAVVVLCIMAILFCILWIGQIRDFKKLNTAKFTVLNEMAPHLEFDSGKPGTIVSYRPFEKEWDQLGGKLQGLKKIGKTKILALKSSNIEYFIPNAFAFLFAGILLTLVILVCSNWPPTKLVQPDSAPAAPAQGKKL